MRKYVPNIKIVVGFSENFKKFHPKYKLHGCIMDFLLLNFEYNKISGLKGIGLGQ
jgi:hypothetical protein